MSYFYDLRSPNLLKIFLDCDVGEAVPNGFFGGRLGGVDEVDGEVVT